jgi:hypothetical protein
MSSTKKVVDKDASADRPMPTHREPVNVNVVEAHGVTNPDHTKDQTTRSHELAADSEAKSQGAVVAGKVGDGCVDSEPGFANAKRRAQAIAKRRKETEAAFDALRPPVAGTRERLGR